ncbi:MAG: phosphodiester glycosidase family protein [Chitinophagaceae bacterium]|nr:phosphodiester glycosidase family protein [Chitinophagaceae bacterium]
MERRKEPVMLRNEASKILAAGILLAVCFYIPTASFGQVQWINVDADYGPLPSTVQVFKTTDSLDGKPFIAFYVKAKLKDRKLDFTVDTTLGRRLTPLQFYEKNDKPLLVVNGTFFSFATNQNLNVVIKNGEVVSHNIKSVKRKRADSTEYVIKINRSAIGIRKNRNADVAWIVTDSTKDFAKAWQFPPFREESEVRVTGTISDEKLPQRWRMQTAIGGGPVLVQSGTVMIFNEKEMMFTGKAINDKHPRTCMGYTGDGYLIIMAIQGRLPGIAEGATLEQEAKLLKDLGCIEALNLDGGGSSCMLVNGKETITPSSKGLQRPVPAVFIIAHQ